MNSRFAFLAKHLPTAASMAVAILPIVVLLLWGDVSRKIIGRGALAYAAGAVGLKLPLYHLIVTKILHNRLTHFQLAFVQGALSALSELGAAFVFFRFFMPALTLPEIVGFGVAAGSIEAVILPFMKNPLEGTPLEEHAGAAQQKAASDMRIQWLGVVERILASLLHTASRGLVYVGAATGNPLPILLALAGFGAIDGRAYYAHLQRWAFDEPRVLVGFYRYFAAITISLISLFLLFYYFQM